MCVSICGSAEINYSTVKLHSAISLQTKVKKFVGPFCWLCRTVHRLCCPCGRGEHWSIGPRLVCDSFDHQGQRSESRWQSIRLPPTIQFQPSRYFKNQYEICSGCTKFQTHNSFITLTISTSYKIFDHFFAKTNKIVSGYTSFHFCPIGKILEKYDIRFWQT